MKLKKKTIAILLISLIAYFTGYTLLGETLPEPPSNILDPNAGTEENPFLIANLANLRWLSETPYFWGQILPLPGAPVVRYFFIQTVDIDATETKQWNEGRGFKPIGNTTMLTFYHDHIAFFGEYNGQNFEISNLYINNPVPITHFATVEASMFGMTLFATIKNMHLKDIQIIRDNGIISPLVGRATMTNIKNCSVMGDLYASNPNSGQVSGLIHYALNSHIEYVYSKVNIYDNTSHLFGVIGLIRQISNSTLENAFFRGSIISNEDKIGNCGLIGSSSYSDIKFCYVSSNGGFTNTYQAINDVLAIHPEGRYSIVTNNFWDMDTTDIQVFVTNYNPGHIIENNYGKSSNEMKQVSTFIENGWDFENIWSINPYFNDGYPYLQSMPNKPNSPLSFALVVENNDVFLSWVPPNNTVGSSSFLGYKLYRNELLLTESNCLTYIDYEIDIDVLYRYDVVAVYDFAESSPVSLSIFIPAFYPPQSLKANTLNNELELMWKAPHEINNGFLTGYRIYRENEVLIDFLDANIFSYKDVEIDYDIEYSYFITALYENPAGESDPSNVINVVLESLIPPIELKSDVDKNNVTLNWIAPDNNPLGFCIYRNGELLTPSYITNTYFVDHDVPNGIYFYCVFSVYMGGISDPAMIEVLVEYSSEIDDSILPLKNELIGNFPNPFNPETIILYSIKVDSNVQIDVFNIRGQKVLTLVDDVIEAGHHQTIWNGRDVAGREVGSGVYLYRIQVGSESITKRMLLLK